MTVADLYSYQSRSMTRAEEQYQSLCRLFHRCLTHSLISVECRNCTYSRRQFLLAVTFIPVIASVRRNKQNSKSTIFGHCRHCCARIKA